LSAEQRLMKPGPKEKSAITGTQALVTAPSNNGNGFAHYKPAADKPFIQIAERMQHISYAIRDMVALAQKVQATGKKVHWFNIGDPGVFGFDPPAQIKMAIAQALRFKFSGYAPSQGDPLLRLIVAKNEGVDVGRVFITEGLSEGIDFAIQALVNQGENVLLPAPGYPLYNTKMKAIFAKANFYRTDENFQPDLDDMRARINESTKAICIINPNNPTGAVYSRQTLQQIAEIAAEYKLPIIADEIYSELTIDGEPTESMASIAKDVPVIVGKGLSKNFIYPGARVGYLAIHGPESDKLAVEMSKLGNARLSTNWETQLGGWFAFKMHQNEREGRNGRENLFAEFDQLGSLATPFVKEQYRKFIPAVDAVLNYVQSQEGYKTVHGQIDDFRSELRIRRDLVHNGLNSIEGIHCPKPEGAFYAFARVENDTFATDTEFANHLLEKTGVFVVPGSGFAPNLPGKFFRLVFLAEQSELQEAMGKIDDYMHETITSHRA